MQKCLWAQTPPPSLAKKCLVRIGQFKVTLDRHKIDMCWIFKLFHSWNVALCVRFFLHNPNCFEPYLLMIISLLFCSLFNYSPAFLVFWGLFCSSAWRRFQALSKLLMRWKRFWGAGIYHVMAIMNSVESQKFSIWQLFNNLAPIARFPPLSPNFGALHTTTNYFKPSSILCKIIRELPLVWETFKMW